MTTGLQPIDFYLPDLGNLVIEIDGSMHYYGLSRHEIMRTSLKYRLMDQIGDKKLNYIKLEYFDCVKKGVKPLKIDDEKIIAKINAAIEEKKEHETAEANNMYFNFLLQ